MKIFLVVVTLTFMDGSVAHYNDGDWDHATSYEDCQKKDESQTKEMREVFKNHSPQPSTFITACIQKER